MYLLSLTDISLQIVLPCLWRVFQSSPAAPVLTWQNWPQSKRASGGGDASDDAVEQKADLLALRRCKQKNTSPCRIQGIG